MSRTIVYPARIVRTMDAANPVAEAIAVRGDRVRAVGSVDELMSYPDATIDSRYSDAYLLPGFVEAHSHARTGGVWDHTYLGYLDRTDPAGRRWSGCTTLEAVLDRLREAESQLSESDEPLLAWGLDPIYFSESRLHAVHLDQVSPTRPIHVLHANGHVCTVNTAVLRRYRIAECTATPGVVTDSSGQVTGELQEFAAMALIKDLAKRTRPPGVSASSLAKFAQDAVNTGTTTLTDLGSRSLMDDAGVDDYRTSVDRDFPARLNVFHMGAGVEEMTVSLSEAVERVVELRKLSTDKLVFGNVKLMLDGSIQAFTARLCEPGYFGGQPNGLWAMSPEEFRKVFETFHKAGLLIHVHANGDQTTEAFLDALEAALIASPRPDHRHTCTHSQLSTAAQYRRMATLGACANIFANHIWAWGDQHMDITLGPDRAKRMNAAATALRSGVPISLHSDSPITPLGPLQTVKHAVTRLTMSGRVLGAQERISAQEALEAVTIGGAYMLKMDHAVGSLEAGKFADMAVLSEDPLDVPPERIGDIHVLGTVVGGGHHTSQVRPTG